MPSSNPALPEKTEIFVDVIISSNAPAPSGSVLEVGFSSSVMEKAKDANTKGLGRVHTKDGASC